MRLKRDNCFGCGMHASLMEIEESVDGYDPPILLCLKCLLGYVRAFADARNLPIAAIAEELVRIEGV